MDEPIRQESPALFRSEVIQAKQSSYLGQVLIHQPGRYAFIGLSALLLVLLALVFLLLGSHTRKATAPGLLVPDQGVLRILAPAQGQVLKVEVKEGETVKAGDTLFILSDERISSFGELQTLKGEQLLHRQSLIKKNKEQATRQLARQMELLDMRLHALDTEESTLRAEITLMEQREYLAQANLDRLRELLKRGHIAITELQRAETELLTLASQKQAIKRDHASLKHSRLALMEQRRDQENQYQRDISDAEQSLALLQQEIAENNLRSQQILQAPFDGQVTGLNVRPGQQVTINTLMASLIPQDSKLHAHIYITPRQAGFIESGQNVSLRYAAYPYQKFGMAQGRVLNIASSPYSIHELQPHITSILQNSSTPNAGENYYRVTVELESQHVQLYGKQQPLLTGMQLEADILQEKRKIYEWILEPVFSMTGKM